MNSAATKPENEESLPAWRPRRSVQLVPSAVPRMLDKARSLHADILIFDLEDSVPPGDKVQARKNIAAARAQGGYVAREQAVKINAPFTPWGHDDLEFVISQGIRLILFPTKNGWEDVEKIEAQLAGRPMELILAIESPASVLDLPRIAERTKHTGALMLGPWDYTLSVGAIDSLTRLDDQAGDEHLLFARHMILNQARAKGWTAINGLLLKNPKDPVEFEHFARQSRRMGFDGCGTFYPPNMEIMNRVFSPTPADVDWARHVCQVWDSREPGRNAAVSPKGETVLVHHYALAKHLLERVRLIG